MCVKTVKLRLSFLSIPCHHQVGKELVVCSVLVPQDMAVREWDTPACLTRLSVQHTLMRRWIPEKTRYAGSGTEGGSGAPARSDRDAE